MQVADLHTRRSPTQSDTYQMYWYNWFSWWWARGCSKYVQNWNKHIEKNCASSWSFTRIIQCQCHWASYHETPLALQLSVPVSRIHKLQAIMTKVYRAFHQSLQRNTHQAPRIRTPSTCSITWLQCGLCSHHKLPLCYLPTRFTSACATCSCDQRSALAYCLFAHNSVLTGVCSTY
jgi:hypothetical protein